MPPKAETSVVNEAELETVDPQTQLFMKYIHDKRIVVADTSATSRSGMANLLSKMGAKGSNITLAPTYSDAEEQIASTKPRFVICDYDLGDKCGLELIQKVKANFPDAKDLFFVLVTGNTSQTAVARAAEEDVDTFVIKPFTANSLRASLIKCVLSKIKPSDYQLKIDEGKKALEENRIDDAIAHFEAAKLLDPAPSLACAYIGQVKLLKDELLHAESSYQTGLKFNKIHYKCLAGLFDTLMSQKKFKEAYEVSKKLSAYFPANPQRLTQVLRLAIMTQSYDDIERYYQVFTKIEVRSDEVINYICAALVVCGKYYLNTNNKIRAFELFNKAAVTAGGRSRVLKEIIVVLADQGYSKEAREYLQRFHATERSGDLYQALDLWVLHRSDKSAGEVLLQGRALLTQGVHESLVYQLLIERSIEAGHADAADTLILEAAKRWPDQRRLFEKLRNPPVGT